MLELSEAGLDRPPVGEGFAGGVGRQVAEAVEQAALLGGIEARDGFALGVDESQLRGERNSRRKSP